MIAVAALTALLLDAAFGWPDRLYRRVGHPVGFFAACLSWGAGKGNQPSRSFATRRIWGALLMLGLTGLTILLCVLLEQAAQALLGNYSPLAIAFLAWPALAQHSLCDHGKAVAEALDQSGLAAGQQAVGMICGRDVETLDEQGVARAAIESIAESLSDGIIAPLFWLLIGGLPALWAYKAINTADSMIGHKDNQWRAFGWAAARLDDIANILPARLTALMICLCARGGWRVMWRDHGKHASPNSGWPEAAMAGALDIRVAGPVCYDGEWTKKLWIGHGRADATTVDIRAALHILKRVCLLAWMITGALIWLP